MEHDDIKATIAQRYEFLVDKSAKQQFAKVDYKLKSGMHIQWEHPKQSELYTFIDKHLPSLQNYYYDLFEMLLTKAGDGWNTYFFIDFEEGSRGKLPNDPAYRQYLKPEYILVGLLFFKVFKLDGHIELLRISEFINLLYQEYDDLLLKLQTIVSSLTNEGSSDHNDDKLTQLVKRAFEEFAILGWIAKDTNDEDIFTYQPSFERLRRIYYPQIENIDELIKRKNNA